MRFTFTDCVLIDVEFVCNSSSNSKTAMKKLKASSERAKSACSQCVAHIVGQSIAYGPMDIRRMVYAAKGQDLPAAFEQMLHYMLIDGVLVTNRDMDHDEQADMEQMYHCEYYAVYSEVSP